MTTRPKRRLPYVVRGDIFYVVEYGRRDDNQFLGSFFKGLYRKAEWQHNKNKQFIVKNKKSNLIYSNANISGKK